MKCPKCESENTHRLSYKGTLVMRYIFLLMMALTFSTFASAAEKIDQGKVDQFVKGKTTYSEVVRELGNPTFGLEEMPDGSKIARYSFRGLIRGVFVNSYEPSQTTFFFDKTSVLIRFSTVEMAKSDGQFTGPKSH